MFQWFLLVYPFVNIQKAIENCHGNSGFIHSKWWIFPVRYVSYIYSYVSYIYIFIVMLVILFIVDLSIKMVMFQFVMLVISIVEFP